MVSDHPSRASSADIQQQHLLKSVTKSIALQKTNGQNHSVGHVFTFHEVRNLRIEVRINDKIESELHRFENAIYGILTRMETDKIIALTVRKKGNIIATEKLTLLPGTYLFVINFCRRIPDSIPRRRYAIKEPSTGKLTSQYRLYTMNIFDMFDLNDDQVLDFREFSLYNILSGGGNFEGDEWKALIDNFDHRDDGLTLKAFVEMHHMEAESYETDDLKDMWLSVAELGFDEGFEPSKCCPVFIDYYLSDDEILIERYDTEHWKKNEKEDERMAEWYWNNGTTLPYLKNYALRLWKNDYFGALIAGPTSDSTRYELTVAGSKNVNLLVGADLVINRTIEANTFETLLIGLAVDTSKDWFISVRKLRRDRLISSEVPSAMNTQRSSLNHDHLQQLDPK
uniref:EF-hand domain-containing protein n=1 Tax=Panagrolaimus superbus TaxID=310955 RepID=A0A914ZAN5_9BILA